MLSCAPTGRSFGRIQLGFAGLDYELCRSSGLGTLNWGWYVKDPKLVRRRQLLLGKIVLNESLTVLMRGLSHYPFKAKCRAHLQLLAGEILAKLFSKYCADLGESAKNFGSSPWKNGTIAGRRSMAASQAGRRALIESLSKYWRNFCNAHVIWARS